MGFYFFCLLIGLPSVIMLGIFGFRSQSVKKELLKIEKEKLEVEKKKFHLLELQEENKLLDKKIDNDLD